MLYLLDGRHVKYADFLRLCPKCGLSLRLIRFQCHILLNTDHPNSEFSLESHLWKLSGQHPQLQR